jgi:nifR3 family TIM-barrel protein
MVKIKDLEIGEKPIILAPMEDVTSPPFRYMCKHFGVDYMYSEFVSSEALIRDVEKSFKKIEVFDYEHPFAVQIFGNKVDSMAEAAKIVAATNADVIDINFGCPAKKVAGKGAGAGLLNDIPHLLNIAEAVVKAVDKPVTIKTRLSYDNSKYVIYELAEQLQDVGVAAIAIHGRTKTQMYKGEANWEEIARVKSNPRLKIPVFGNGDIKTPEQAKMAFDKYGVDGVMVGRASIGKPWIFRDMTEYIKTGKVPPLLSLQEKSELALLHLEKSIDWKGLPRGVFEMRQHLSNYFKGIPRFKETRLEMLTCEDVDRLKEIIRTIPQKFADIQAFDNEPDIFGCKMGQ